MIGFARIRKGLVSCGELTINVGKYAGRTVSDVMKGTSGDDNLAQLIWHEDGSIGNADLLDPMSYYLDQVAVGTAVMNQVAVDNGQMTVYANGVAVCPQGHCLHRTLSEIIQLISTYYLRGKLIHTFDLGGHMADGFAPLLDKILRTDITDGQQVTDKWEGTSINIGCEGVLSSISVASEVLNGLLGGPDDPQLLAWNKRSPNVPYLPGFVPIVSTRQGGHTFWGLYTTPTPPSGSPGPPPPVRAPHSGHPRR